jgi:hypothetical protein
MKQLTENRSARNDSAQRGWKLLVIILNYFIPSEHLRPYFVKYVHDRCNPNDRLGKFPSGTTQTQRSPLSIVQLCLNHYEQTLKYGGRKNTPSKAEIDLLTAVEDPNEGCRA